MSYAPLPLRLFDTGTIYRYGKSYQDKGLDGYLKTDFEGYWGRLSCEQISVLRFELRSRLYTTSKEVCDFIQTAFDITYTEDGVVKLLYRIGFGCEFEQKTLGGRGRVNINGAINALSVDEVKAVVCDSVNAQSTKELYQKIIDENPKLEVIHIISDNARYYQGYSIGEWINNTPIRQIFSPAYSLI